MASVEMEALANSIREKEEALLKMLEPLPERISKLLEARRVTDDCERHGLEFIVTELSAIVASLRLRLQPSRVHRRFGVDLDALDALEDKKSLDALEPLRNNVMDIMESLCNDNREEAVAVLQKAMLCFRYRRYFGTEIQWTAYELYLGDSNVELSSSEVVAGALHDHLVGIEGQAEELLRWLMVADDGDVGLKIMAIVGPAGIGKTTLAMEVHRQLQCQTEEYFQCCVVAKFVPHETKLLQTILSQIIHLEAPSAGGQAMILEDNPELLARNISERLSDRRYFVLIDDMRELSDWEVIKDVFPYNNCGSRILFTTRGNSIGWWPFETVFWMEPLSHKNSERLLHMKAFGSMDDPPDNLKLLCDEILTECNGIPLFITCMADGLKQHQQQHYSSAVPRAELIVVLLNYFLEMLSSGDNDMLFLRLLYLSMYPQGYVFDKDNLIMKWLEEGLTKDYVVKAGFYKWKRGLYIDLDSALSQDLCRSFSQLVDWNIVTPVAENSIVNHGEDDLWQINPFIHNFLASRAAEKGFVFTNSMLASATRSGGKNTRIARRLALHHPDPRLPDMLQQMDLSHTRSLLISGAVDRVAIPLDKFAYLVVLDLQGWENLKDEDLLQICEMFTLRYLSIRNTGVSKLPPQIKELRILGTLDISQTHISLLPSEVCELTFLEMLDLRGTQISQLPEQIKRLNRLKALLIGGDLSEYPASFVEDLGQQYELRVLAITWSFHQSTDVDYQNALLSSMKYWNHLKSLTIHCGLGCSMEFLGSLNDPPKDLEKFKVTAGKFARVPQWIRGLGLTFLQLTICKQVPGDVKILAGLFMLQHLVLGLEFIPEEAIVIVSKGFQELQRFSLDCPVPWLTFEEEAMPKLTYLRLNLHAFPASEMSVPSGINNLQILSEVALCYSERYMNSPNIKMTVEAVSKEVAKHSNLIDLFINGIRKVVIRKCDEEAEIAAILMEVNPPEDGVLAADKAALRSATQVQSEIEVEGNDVLLS